MKINTITISEWSQLLDLEPEFGGSVYRGHANASWELETSIRRTVLNNSVGYMMDEDQFAFVERMCLRTFRSRAHFYLNHLPNNEDHVAWLAIMQHHGTPTRLLDFSFSLYVAAYFALINATTDCCVWAISDNWLRSQGTDYALQFGVKPSNDLRFGELAAIYQAANSILGENNFDADEEATMPPTVLMLELDRQIPRLAIQQGLFLMPTNLKETFMLNLESMYNEDINKIAPITKIVFPYKIRSYALMHLRMMNITAETLFPGIDGFAASLIQHEII